MSDEKRPLLGMNPPPGYFRGCKGPPYYIEGWLDCEDYARRHEAAWKGAITGSLVPSAAELLFRQQEKFLVVAEDSNQAPERDYFLDGLLILAGLSGLFLVGIVVWGTL